MTTEVSSRWLKPVATAALLFTFAVLAWYLWAFAAEAVQAVGFVDEIDYGEGIVWQQAEWLFTRRAYGPIDVWPAIVYHYTPVYHLVTRMVSALGVDMLAAGRLVSLGATASIAFCAAAIAVRAAEPKMRAPARWVIAAGAGLSIFCLWPLIYWANMMRVDMLAIALGFAGVLAGIAALRRPWMIHVAAACFVLSIYTKQTELAAPAATFLVLLIFSPGLALRGIVTTILLGLIALLALNWATDGGFVRHVFLYNINRLELDRLQWMWGTITVHILLFLIMFRTAWPRLIKIRARWTQDGRAALGPHDIAWLVAWLYFILAWLMAFTVAKSGSNVNYFIEWLCALCVFVGLALVDAARAATGDPLVERSRSDRFLLAVVLPILVALHGILLKPPSAALTWQPARLPELSILSDRVRAAEKPVISDNMVVLLRSGKPVLWEPAIFAELAHKGVWDERPFVERIRRGEFAFFITVGNRGQRLYDSRYNPAVAEAIAAAYPATEVIAGYTIHRPAGAAPIRPAAPATAAVVR